MEGEPAQAIAQDRSATAVDGTVRLFLPPGEVVRVSIISEDGDVLRSFKYVAETAGSGTD